MHLRFGDSDDEGPGPSGAAPAAPGAAPFAGSGAPPALGGAFQCVSSVRTDFEAQDTCYVFELAHSPGGSLVAAALSNKRIKLFNFRWGEGGPRWGEGTCAAGCRAAAGEVGQPADGSRALLLLHSRPVCPCPLPHPPPPPRSEGGLSFVGDLVGHEGMLRELHFGLPDAPHLLHSCGADGTVRGWDTRSGQQVEW